VPKTDYFKQDKWENATILAGFEHGGQRFIVVYFPEGFASSPCHTVMRDEPYLWRSHPHKDLR
jgi:hypothetical protein